MDEPTKESMERAKCYLESLHIESLEGRLEGHGLIGQMYEWIEVSDASVKALAAEFAAVREEGHAEGRREGLEEAALHIEREGWADCDGIRAMKGKP